jgi:magnesium transporter
MLYLSQLLGRYIYYKNQKYAKLIDLAVDENRAVPSVSKILLRKDGKKLSITPGALTIKDGEEIVVNDINVPIFPYDVKDFYLYEDLLDKQVIDVDGKRLVRVNDVILEANGVIKVIGIDIGFSGILRRLSLEWLLKLKPKTLPWSIIEAFDYRTGNIKLRLTQPHLNNFHPSEIAEILEQAGAKERLGIVEVLDAKKAARAIEELDNEAQASILKQVALNPFKKIISLMKLSEIADVFNRLSSLRKKEIDTVLGEEKYRRVEKLAEFSGDVAGGIMDILFYQIDGNTTVKELLTDLNTQNIKPESLVVTNGNKRMLGILDSKILVNMDPLALLKDLVSQKKFVYSHASFHQVLKLFSQYNLRMLPVINSEKQVIGVIKIDQILQMLEERQIKDEFD